jgi:hypothetical protein
VTDSYARAGDIQEVQKDYPGYLLRSDTLICSNSGFSFFAGGFYEDYAHLSQRIFGDNGGKCTSV